MRNWVIKSLLGLFFFLAFSFSEAASNRHVVLVVWDGMRPDFVSEKNTPTLWQLAQSGVTFRNHHSVYPSATVVNGTAMATGVYPDRSGIIANHDYFPGIDLSKPVDVETLPAVLRGDAISNNKYIAAPTIAEIVRRGGGTTAIVAAKGVGLIFDRHLNRDSRCADCLTIFEGNVFPPERAKQLLEPLGEFPALEKKHFAQTDAWTTRALTDQAWRDRIPTLSVLWLSEPDGSEHSTAPGSPEALTAIKSSDENLGRVLAALDRHHARADTDVLVVSDHGFSTIERSIDLGKILKEAGFDAVTEFAGPPKPGQIMMAGNGGSVLFYVIGHDAGVVRKLVELLQQSDFAGVIFTRDKLEGTFALNDAKLDTQQTADVVMAFRWNDNKNQFGVPGMIDADWQRAAGKGTHATLSKFDMHNTLICAGPDFKKGLTSELSSGNVDLAPTILAILGIKLTLPMDGRVLAEAMTSAPVKQENATTQTSRASKKFPAGTWTQSLRFTRVGSTIYLDEGNGRSVR